MKIFDEFGTMRTKINEFGGNRDRNPALKVVIDQIKLIVETGKAFAIGLKNSS